MFYVQVTGVCTGEIFYVQVNRSIYSKNASRIFSRNIYVQVNRLIYR